MSVIQAGNTTTTSLIYTGDTTGNLVFTTGGANTTALTLSNAQAATFVGSINTPNTFGFKNRIINGGITISQYNGTSSVTPTNASYPLDRWTASMTASGKFTVQQSSTAPTGFINSLLCTSTSAYTLATGEFVSFRQFIEGLNVADLAWGTANAKTVTLSFWVYSSLTGTFGGTISNSAQNRVYVFSYSISSANTWTQISITVAGDTTGTWLTTNGIGIGVRFCIGAASDYQGTPGSWGTTVYTGPTGQTSLVATNGATFYITGIQLESGSQATSFDFRSYTNEFAMCQRYYFTNGGNNILSAHPASIYARINYFLPVAQRTTGTTTFKDAAGTSGVYTSYSTNDTATNGVSAIAFGAVNNQILQILLPNSDAGVNAGFSYTSSAEL